MMPSARVSCRKAKVPTTLMAVRADPEFRLRSKSIMDQAPFHKRGAGDCLRIWPEMGVDLESSPLFSTDDWGMAAAMPLVSRRITKKIRVFGLRLNITSTFLNGVALVVLNKGSGIKKFLLCEQVPIFVVLSSGSKKGSQPLPLPPPLPRSLQCSLLILAVSATFALRSTVPATSPIPSPAVSGTTRNKPSPSRPDFAPLSRSCPLSRLLRKDHFQDFSSSLTRLPLLSRVFHQRKRSRHPHRLQRGWTWHSQASRP